MLLIGDTASVQGEAEKWAGPFLTSTASLAATAFAYLTSRDRLRFDSKSEIREARLVTAEATIVRLETEIKEMETERKLLNEKMSRVIANFQAHLLKRPLPYPNEFGGTGEAVALPKG